MAKEKTKAIQVRIPESVFEQIEKEASRIGIPINSFFALAIEEKLNTRQQNIAIVKKNTMDLILNWNSVVTGMEKELLKVSKPESNRLQFIKDGCRVYCTKDDAYRDRRFASLHMLNYLEGIAYGLSNGVIDKGAKDIFPIKYWGMEVLIGIQAAYIAFHENKNDEHGWPGLEAYLNELTNNKFEDELMRWVNSFKEDPVCQKNHNTTSSPQQS